ncbi:MAG: hypothetical protein FWD73_16845 [Polyangiaceae bacterium]|nr:hypothetical protein [Polyangiaceae bacterium]
MKNFSIAGLLVAVGCLASCGGAFGDAPGSGSSDGGSSDQTNGGGTDSGGGGGSKLDGGSVDPGPTFSFVQADGPVYVRQGQPISVTINIARGITPGTDITIRATSWPDGVSVGSLTIPPGQSTGKLAITVDESIPQGELKDDLVLQGLADGATVAVPMDLKLFVRGAPGTLDPTFGSNGIYEDLTEYANVYTVVSQSDGKILIGAWNTDWATSAVIRLKADGSVDSTLTDSSIQKISGQLGNVTADANGRIVTSDVLATTINRYKANGAPDTTLFNANSSPPIPDNWVSFFPYAVVVDQDGSIYAGGETTFLNNNGFYTREYSFLQIATNEQGRMPGCSGSWDNANYQYITKLSLLPTGALAFAGIDTKVDFTGNVGVGVGRSPQPQSPCDLDLNYGDKGIWHSTDWQILGDAFFEIDGSVDLLVGSTSTTPGVYSLVHIDPTGKQTANVESPLVCYGYTYGIYFCSITRAPEPDRRYLVAGQLQPAGNDSMAVVYYKSDLTPDTSIGDQGSGIVNIPVHTALTNSTGVGLRAVYMPDGERTVVVGSISGVTATNATVAHLVVARIWN